MPRIVKQYSRLEAELISTEGLTPRQQQISRLMVKNMTNAEIAAELGLSVDTVNGHVERMKGRFQADTKLDLLCQMWMHGFFGAQARINALVICLCILAAFPMGRTHRTQSNGSVRQEMRISKTARKELAAPVGEYA